jgi:tryptophan-rich sensory protein
VIDLYSAYDTKPEQVKNLAAITGIGLVAVYAIGSGLWVNTGDSWYRNLNAPAWQPPDFVFGLIWPYNFIVLGIAAVMVAQRATTTATFIYLGFFAASVVCALTWAYQFYVPHNLQLAAFSLALTALLTIPMVLVALRTSIPLGVALLPYQAWVATAAVLSYNYSKLN